MIRERREGKCDVEISEYQIERILDMLNVHLLAGKDYYLDFSRNVL